MMQCNFGSEVLSLLDIMCTCFLKVTPKLKLWEVMFCFAVQWKEIDNYKFEGIIIDIVTPIQLNGG